MTKNIFNISLILIQYLDNLTGLPRLRRLSLVNNNLTLTQVGIYLLLYLICSLQETLWVHWADIF